MQKVEARIPDDILKRIEDECQKNNMTISQYVRYILIDYFSYKYTEQLKNQLIKELDKRYLNELDKINGDIDNLNKVITEQINKVVEYVDKQVDKILAYVDKKNWEHIQKYIHTEKKEEIEIE
jgi:hypothetical protein